VPYFALIHLAGQYLLYKYEAKTLNWKDAKWRIMHVGLWPDILLWTLMTSNSAKVNKKALAFMLSPGVKGCLIMSLSPLGWAPWLYVWSMYIVQRGV
jgi:hypothetical protein